MEIFWCVFCFCLFIGVPSVFLYLSYSLLRPIAISLAKKLDTRTLTSHELKELKDKIKELESELLESKHRILTLEDENHFIHNLLICERSPDK